MDLEAWFGSGTRLPVRTGDGRSVELFVRTQGDGPWTTFLHGFPTCSWDWAPLAEVLPGDRSRLYPDLLGFGDSDKPRGHDYSLVEQLDLVRQVWDHHDVDRTVLVVHDYSVSIAQEILARMVEDDWSGPEIPQILFLNGGLFYGRIRPMAVQQLLRVPVLGAVVARLITRRGFDRAFARLFSEEHPISREELARHWEAIRRRGGRRVVHRIARYQNERRRYEDRWTEALSDAPIPIRFAWGLKDPVSGGNVAEGIRLHAPDAPLEAWDDVGHYPQLEVPKRVADEVRTVEG